MKRLHLPLLIALIAALALPAGARASSSQFTIFEAPRELLSGDAALRDRTVGEIHDLGAHWVRVVVYWHSVAPGADSATRPSFDETDPAAYDWSRYDPAIQALRAHGFRVLLTVSGPVPRWATHDRDDTVTRPSPTRFRRFMQAIGTHYGRDVDYWSIWNEPNHPGFLMPQYKVSHGHRTPVSPGLYRTLFQQGVKGLRASAGNAHDRVLMGETAPVGTTKVVAPLTFVRGAMCLDSRYRKRRGCAKLDADGYAHHAYGHGAPWTPTRSSNDVTMGTLSRLNHALAVAGSTGAIRKNMGIYLTEFGVQSKPDPYIGVSFTAQAEYRSIAEHMAYGNGRVRSFSQYLMRDDTSRPGPAKDRYAGFESGLRTSEGDPKLSYDGFRLPLVARKVSRGTVSLWGLVRPQHAKRERVTIDYRTHGSTWHRLKTDTTNSRGYWSTTTRYRSGATYRVRWDGMAGPSTPMTSHG